MATRWKISSLPWSRVEGGEKISGMIDQLLQDFSLLHPEKSVPGLVTLYKAIGQLKDGYWKTQKLKEVQQLIEACSGLWLEAVVRAPYCRTGRFAVGHLCAEQPAEWRSDGCAGDQP